MLGVNYYNGLFRKYVTYFGSIFSDIVIDRVDSSGNAVKSLPVPIEFGPKERYLARQLQNPDLLREVSLVLPRMAFEIIDISYDPSRKLNTMGQITNYSSPNKDTVVYNPVPYNIQFLLSVMTRNTEDGMRIVEQIFPFFTPAWSQTLTINAAAGISYSIPVLLNSVKMTDTYANNFEAKDLVIWDLTFTMKAYFFGPISTQGVIKEIIINLHDVDYANNIVDVLGTSPNTVIIDIKPGLTANGLPTSNAALSVNTNLITSNSDYGYITNITEDSGST